MTIDEIYNQMCEIFLERTGVEAGTSTELSVRLYAVAAQVHALYLEGEWVKAQCFPQTAQGEYLDLHGQTRGIARRAASRAEGTIRFYVDSAQPADLTIGEGTVCSTAAQVQFVTRQAGVLEAGQLWVDVPARAVEAGAAGNVASGAILTMAVPPVGFSRCGNPEAFYGGTDTEGDEEFRARILETYSQLANGANAAYYEKEAMGFSGVAAVKAVGKNRGVGTVDVFVASHEGIPEQSLLTEIQDYFQERREIAVDVQVLPPTGRTVDVAAAISVAEGGDFDQAAAAAKAEIQAWFGEQHLGEKVLRAQLGSLIFGAEGVANYDLTSPAQDVDIGATELPILGALTITELEEN